MELLNIIILIISFTSSKSSSIILQNTTVYKEGVLHKNFNYSLEGSTVDCSSRGVFYLLPNEEKIELTLLKNDSLEETKFNSESSQNFIKVKLETTQINDSTSNITILTTCDMDQLKSSNNYWGEVFLKFRDSDNDIVMKYVKFCDRPGTLLTLLSGLMIFILATLILYFATTYEIKFEDNEIRENGELKTIHAIMFVLIGSLMLMFIYFFKNLATILVTIIVSGQSSMALYMTLKTIGNSYYIQENPPMKKEVSFLNYRTNIYNMYLIILTVIFIAIWLVTKHWLFNNILSFCLSFTILSLIHIKNLKICILILLLTFFYDVFWVFFSSRIFSKNVMETAAMSLNLPIKMGLPLIFSNNPIKECTFLGLGDIVIPGLTVKFLFNYDKSRHIHIYYKTSILFYFLGLLICGIFLFVFNHSQPALFYLSPALILSTLIKAYFRNDIEDLMIGIRESEEIPNHVFSSEIQEGGLSSVNDVLDIEI